jgi:hypothetical protein
VPEWLWSITVGLVVLGLIGLVWRAQEKRIKDLEDWRRDKEKVDYEFRHDELAPVIAGINRDLLPLVKQVEVCEKRVDELKDWKHDVADLYLPRAVEDHERRLNRLDARVFNGHRE